VCARVDRDFESLPVSSLKNATKLQSFFLKDRVRQNVFPIVLKYSQLPVLQITYTKHGKQNKMVRFGFIN